MLLDNFVSFLSKQVGRVMTPWLIVWTSINVQIQAILPEIKQWLAKSWDKILVKVIFTCDLHEVVSSTRQLLALDTTKASTN